MLLEEWNMEDAIAYARKEGREDGIELGMEKGRFEGRVEGIEKGRAEGIEKGREERDTYFLDLLGQGLSVDEIRQRIYSERKSI